MGRYDYASDVVLRELVSIHQQSNVFAEFVQGRASTAIATLDLDAEDMAVRIARQDIDPATRAIWILDNVFFFEELKARFNEIEVSHEEISKLCFIGEKIENLLVWDTT